METRKIICDDCKQREIKKDSPHNKVMITTTSGQTHKWSDVCDSCLLERLQHSFAIVPIGRECPECNGQKKVKEGYGHHNDHNWEVCSACEGTGYHRLKPTSK